jgi:hypothetical protein
VERVLFRFTHWFFFQWFILLSVRELVLSQHHLINAIPFGRGTSGTAQSNATFAGETTSRLDAEHAPHVPKAKGLFPSNSLV